MISLFLLIFLPKRFLVAAKRLVREVLGEKFQEEIQIDMR